MARAIVHFDGDSFFASVEQVLNYTLRGKPVVTGGERGAPTSVSYEGKKRGLARGMSMREIKIRCPDAIIVPSNYTAYAIFAQRMYGIVRSHAPIIEEYSIDECFADVTDLANDWKGYEKIARIIKSELEDSLGVTFGVGLASTKTIAKAASKAHKPAGFTSVPPEYHEEFLSTVSIHTVWGLGGASGSHLEKVGVTTALEFAQRDDQWLTMHRFGKAYRDIWLELNGHSIKQVGEERRAIAGSLMCTRTFTPPSLDRSFILSQVSKNLEAACEKARRQRVCAKGLSFYLKTQAFTYHAVSLELTTSTADPAELLAYIESRFDEVYVEEVLYRASGITLRSLIPDHARMSDLFASSNVRLGREKILAAVDTVNDKYGRNTVFFASSMQALSAAVSKDGMKRKNALTVQHKTLKVPMLGVVS